MSVAGAWTEAGWPAPPGIRGGTSLRGGDGLSPPPFDRLNLGLRCGDDPAHARANRERLAGWLGLPSTPHWLDQVHGTTVVRVDAPPAGPLQLQQIERTLSAGHGQPAVGGAQYLAGRASRCAELLRTRVNVAVEAQNQEVLESMNRRAAAGRCASPRLTPHRHRAQLPSSPNRAPYVPHPH